MKINAIILTTETPHHAFFIKSLIEYRDIDFTVVIETTKKPIFKVQHKIDKDFLNYENKNWFNFKNNKVKNYCKPLYSFSLNKDNKILKILKKKSPSFVFIFGTSILSKKFLKHFKNIYNFHGGDMEKFRGLDSHLWAIYHNKYDSLFTYLHEALPRVDSGKYVFKKKIKINKNFKLETLRYQNTINCLKMAKKFINSFKKNDLKRYKLKSLGRYYSFMPYVLKDEVIKNFKKYVV